MDDPARTPAHRRTFGWAIFRWILGMGQIIGSTASATLLLSTGPSRLAVGGVAFTGLLTLTSRLLFRTRVFRGDLPPFSRKPTKVRPAEKH